MDVTAKKILSDLKAKKYAPVYVLQGEEVYYIDLITNYIEANVLSESDKSFNQVVLYGKDGPVQSILTHARRYPMMAERQVVIVKEAQDIPDLQKEAGSKLLLDYFTKPVPTTLLVLCHKHKALDKRRELGKKVEQLTISATFKRSHENQLPGFVQEYCREKGVDIAMDAINVFCEYVGNDLSRMANEIDKVIVGTDNQNSITAGQVMAQVGMSREFNIFEMQKAVIRRDALVVAKIVNYFEANPRKNPAIPMVAFLFSFFSKLLVASASTKHDKESLVSLLKINPFAVPDYSLALQRFSTIQLIQIIGFIKLADLKLKGVNSLSDTDGHILKELAFKILAA